MRLVGQIETEIDARGEGVGCRIFPSGSFGEAFVAMCDLHVKYIEREFVIDDQVVKGNALRNSRTNKLTL